MEKDELLIMQVAKEYNWIERMMLVAVKEDGRVGSWFEWVGIMSALSVLWGYNVLNFISFMALSHVLDPFTILTLFIPIGIVLGDVGYRLDLDVNSPK